jgi:uncharacterized membrane protein
MSEHTPHSPRHISIKSFQAKKNAQRTQSERLADFLTSHLGTMEFFILNLLWFTV